MCACIHGICISIFIVCTCIHAQVQMRVFDVGFIAFYLRFLLSEPGDHWIGKVGWPLAFRDSPMSTAPPLQLQTCIAISGFSLSVRDPNLEPYAHAADTLLNKPPSQSQYWASLRHFHTCVYLLWWCVLLIDLFYSLYSCPLPLYYTEFQV